jgi:selenocysteine-specific elongation factor
MSEDSLSSKMPEPHSAKESESAGPASTDPRKRQGLVLGTAGHIDHGKTSLVRALTGNDLDRLPEEKARGITIELGFTPLELDDGARIALVDVPGHERFVRTMVAGASGLDLLMLVVAADEGVMPQTREHLAICELLGIERGLVVLTKSDLVDEEMLELAEEDVRDALADGPLAGLSILPASATTGEGIDDVRAELARLVETAPARDDDARPSRLFIDRTFTKHGFGTVVTGTWSGRPRAVGDSIVLEPGTRNAKIRGLERHGDAVEEADSGARIAVNLQGIAHDEIHRGDLIAEPGALMATRSFDASVKWMARKASLDDSMSIELLTGTTERRARIAKIGEKPLTPGDTGFARIHIEGDPLALLPGDRFVVRGFARDAGVGSTLGGGVVLDVAPPHRRRRDAQLTRDLERLAEGTPADVLDVRIARSGLQGISVRQLALESGFDSELLDLALRELASGGRVARLSGATCLSEASAQRLMKDLLLALDRFHEASPLQPGMPRAALTGTLPANTHPEAGAALLETLVERGDIEIHNEVVTRVGFSPKLGAAQKSLVEALRKRFAEAGLEAPALRTLADELGEEGKRLRELAHFLEREGTLVAAPDELFFDRGAVLELIDRVLDHFDENEELDTQTLKTMIGTSRRTAMPLMALLDDLQITRRDGSLRRLVNRAPRW